MPTQLQLKTTGSGSAWEESVATMKMWARHSDAAKTALRVMASVELKDRTHTAVLTAPLSGRIAEGYMIDSRVPRAVASALADIKSRAVTSTLADKLLRYSDMVGFEEFAEAIVPLNELETLQEQVLRDIDATHPHKIFSAFARRLEKTNTIKRLIGFKAMGEILRANANDARHSFGHFLSRMSASAT